MSRTELNPPLASPPFGENSHTTLPLSLALQGGGSLGAFTWGVIDRLLQTPDVAFDTISGVSAGAINAGVLAGGLLAGGAEGARERLERFWRRASSGSSSSSFTQAFAMSSRLMSPYLLNPFDLNPLRTLLTMELDLDALRQAPPFNLLIGATRVRDGSLRLFEAREITTDVLLASACLPQIHQAVTIDGEDYWDGGYAANPPLLPLIERSQTARVLVIRIIPTRGQAHVRRLDDIRRRLDQLNFNLSLDHDLEAIATLRRYGGPNPFARCDLHVLNAEDTLPDLDEADALKLDWGFLQMLRDAGRNAAEAWLSQLAATEPPRPSPAAQSASSPARYVG